MHRLGVHELGGSPRGTGGDTHKPRSNRRRTKWRSVQSSLGGREGEEVLGIPSSLGGFRWG
jgi:hypothetical protein